MAKENKTTYAILGLLSHEDLSGYDIKKRIDQSLSMFWDTGFGQIYPTLKVLEQQELVTSRTETGDHRPDRIIYSITETGRRELREWLKIPAAKENVRYEILLKLFFGKLLSLNENITNIENFAYRYAEKQNMLQMYRQELSKVLQEDEDHLYYYLTVLFGEKVFGAYLEWAEEAVQLLQEYKKTKR